MKINTLAPTGRGLSKIMKEIRWFTHAITAVMVLYLGASLVPGDKIGFNVIGTLGLLVFVIVGNLVITVPLTLWIRMIGKPVLAPVRSRVKAHR